VVLKIHKTKYVQKKINKNAFLRYNPIGAQSENTRKKNLNYTSTDKKKLTWRKFVSKDKEKWQVF